MPGTFKRATKESAKARLALAGPAGSGKTWTALKVGTVLAGDAPLACVDTEHGSASKYSDHFEFDSLELTSFAPQKYIDAIHAAEEDGYGALVIDSLSHAWMGKGGVLEMHDSAVAKQRGGNTWTAWRDVTPQHNQLVEAMVQCRIHLIVTLRSKTAYVQEKDNEGKTTIRRLGMEAVQRDGLEYEFDVYGDLDYNNTLVIAKTRCPDFQGAVVAKPGEEFANTLLNWVSAGVPHEVRVQAAHDLWRAAAKAAKAAGVTHKDLPENATVQQIERWASALMQKVKDSKKPVEASA